MDTHSPSGIAGDGLKDLTPVEAAILQLSRSLAVAVALLEQQQQSLKLLEQVVAQTAGQMRQLAVMIECGWPVECPSAGANEAPTSR